MQAQMMRSISPEKLMQDSVSTAVSDKLVLSSRTAFYRNQEPWSSSLWEDNNTMLGTQLLYAQGSGALARSPMTPSMERIKDTLDAAHLQARTPLHSQLLLLQQQQQEAAKVQSLLQERVSSLQADNTELVKAGCLKDATIAGLKDANGQLHKQLLFLSQQLAYRDAKSAEATATVGSLAHHLQLQQIYHSDVLSGIDDDTGKRASNVRLGLKLPPGTKPQQFRAALLQAVNCVCPPAQFRDDQLQMYTDHAGFSKDYAIVRTDKLEHAWQLRSTFRAAHPQGLMYSWRDPMDGSEQTGMIETASIFCQTPYNRHASWSEE